MRQDPRRPGYMPPDFVDRPPQLENQINHAFARVFAPDWPSARLVLDYLTATFLNRIVGPQGSDADLRHREGQRDLVRIIKQRIEHGRDDLPKIEEVP